MRLVIACDHAAYELKNMLFAWLQEQGYKVQDLGCYDEKSVDYPDIGYKIAAEIEAKTADRGIALCGSGIGIAIAVNRNPSCRCALVSDVLSAQLSRSHNDANVLAMGARLLGDEMAKACITAFLQTEFSGGRHAARVAKL